MSIGVYKITSPKGKIYIGQSSNIEARFRQYRKLRNCDQQRLLYNSFIKYGVLNHSFEVVMFCLRHELDATEIFYISTLNALDKDVGLNLKSGGSRGKHHESSKAKISKANKGKKRTEETKRKLSIAQKKNNVKYWLGKKRSVSDRLTMSLSHIGIGNASCEKRIVQLNRNGAIIKIFDSTIKAAKELNIGRTGIKNCLRGGAKTAGGFIFKFHNHADKKLG